MPSWNAIQMVKTRRLRLAGHVLRQPEERPANVAMNWLHIDGKMPRGRPQKTWGATFADLQDIGVTWRGPKRVANNHQRWRNLVTRCSNVPTRTGETKSKLGYSFHALQTFYLMQPHKT